MGQFEVTLLKRCNNLINFASSIQPLALFLASYIHRMGSHNAFMGHGPTNMQIAHVYKECFIDMKYFVAKNLQLIINYLVLVSNVKL
jgi:hypothetical protein